MSKTQYRRCCVDGIYHHPDETILLPEGRDRNVQQRFCLDHAEKWIKGEIDRVKFARLHGEKRRFG